MITAKEILMGREKEYPLNSEQIENLLDLLPRINLVRFHYTKPLIVSSGYRPGHYNKAAGGAKNSCHLACQAVDFKDPKGDLAEWCLENMDILERAGLYLEDPRHTKGWVHLQSRPTRNNPFIP